MRRNNLWIAVILWFLATNMSAQVQGVNFEPTRSWAKVLEKAKKEKKLIFVDCYASWCEPCKQLEQHVFTDIQVADFFNEHFINARFDMEKDIDGKSHTQQWGIVSFPTLLFIDPETEQPVGKLVGASDATRLLEGAKNVMDPTKRLDALVEKYNHGERGEEFLMNLIQVLAQAGMTEQVEQVVREWLESLPLDRLATPDIWQLIMQFDNDPLSKTLLVVRDNLERFYAIPLPNQKTMVDAKLASAMVQTAMEFAMSPNLAVYSQDRYNSFIDYLAQMPDSPGKAAASVWLNTSLLSRKGDWKQMLEVMRVVDEEKILPEQIYNQYFVFFLKSLPQMKEKNKAVAEAVKWLDELIDKEHDQTPAAYQTRAALYAAQASLWQDVGNADKMHKAQVEMNKYVELLNAAGASNLANTSQATENQTSNSINNEIVHNGKAQFTYELREGVPIVKVIINGHTYSFLFDTCAGYNCVSDRLVNTEGLSYQQTGNSIAGMQGALNMTSIPSLSMGKVTFNNTEAAILSGNNPTFQVLGIDGIIGAPLINQYVLTIDSRSKMISIESEPDNSIEQWNEFKLHGLDPLLSIKVRGNEELYDVPALFDTGNGTGAINLPSAKGFEEWSEAGVIGDVEKGVGFNAMMIGGISKTTEKLYRGKLTELHIGDGSFNNIPVITGGMDYLLLCFKITDLGKITLDYPKKRFSFQSYTDAIVWEGDHRPVLSAVVDGKLRIAALWGDESIKKMEVGETVTMVGTTQLNNLSGQIPNIDLLIRQTEASTVTIEDRKGKQKQLPADIFLPNLH